MATKRRGLGGIDALIPPSPDETPAAAIEPAAHPVVDDGVDESRENTTAGGQDSIPDEEHVVSRVPAGERMVRAQQKTARQTGAADASGAKEKFGGYVPPEVADAVRNVIYRVPGLRIGDFLAEASIREIRRLEKIHNNGQPFAPRPDGESLPTGRQVR